MGTLDRQPVHRWRWYVLHHQGRQVRVRGLAPAREHAERLLEGTRDVLLAYDEEHRTLRFVCRWEPRRGLVWMRKAPFRQLAAPSP